MHQCRFAEPETPVIATSMPNGISTSRCSGCGLAPRKTLACVRCRIASPRGNGIESSPAQITSRSANCGFVIELVVHARGQHACHQFSPAPGPRSSKIVRRAHHIRVVLDHQDGVAQIAQIFKMRISRRCRGCAIRWKVRPARRALPPAANRAKSPAGCAALLRRKGSRPAGRE